MMDFVLMKERERGNNEGKEMDKARTRLQGRPKQCEEKQRDNLLCFLLNSTILIHRRI